MSEKKVKYYYIVSEIGGQLLYLSDVLDYVGIWSLDEDETILYDSSSIVIEEYKKVCGSSAGSIRIMTFMRYRPIKD